MPASLDAGKRDRPDHRLAGPDAFCNTPFCPDLAYSRNSRNADTEHSHTKMQARSAQGERLAEHFHAIGAEYHPSSLVVASKLASGERPVRMDLEWDSQFGYGTSAKLDLFDKVE